jgi:hypothetical protein
MSTERLRKQLSSQLVAQRIQRMVARLTNLPQLSDQGEASLPILEEGLYSLRRPRWRPATVCSWAEP